MTSPPDLPAQIEAVREAISFEGGGYHGFPRRRRVEALRAAIVTLEQHERLEAALREPSEDLQDALAEAFDAAFLPAWREAIKKHGTNNVQPAWASWGRKYLTAIADALDATAPETPETR